jgi:hypothetical protein
MADDDIFIEYNDELAPLEQVLAGVKRAGKFEVHGQVELPMPRVEVEGTGVLSFPIPQAQIATLIQQAVRAPFGRGPETILDETVRKVWQLPADKVRISGKSWAASFEAILDRVAAGLGCERKTMAADLYKLLVYDQGGFFQAHRDTEKAGGMFGTLVMVLPAPHSGGELVVRHAGHEVVVDLSGGDVSEVSYAAFYADCEHEVRAITAGNRVCLIFNLCQTARGKGHDQAPTAPEYEPQVFAAAELLGRVLGRKESAAKVAWLLEHQYSPAGLAFSALKSADAARAEVLVEAAARAGCTIHLGIVHIEESGSAEPSYSDYRPRRRGRYWETDDEESDDEGTDAEFEIIEVTDSWQYVDQWIDPLGRAVAFGKLPLQAGELLPKGALDEEKPDQQRLTEATGNEGASFERSYHRAALVIWHRTRYAEVLLQAGAGSALPWLEERVAASTTGGDSAARREAVELAHRMIEKWPPPGHIDCRAMGGKADRASMLAVLGRLGEAALLEEFVRRVVFGAYDGSENAALVAQLPALAATRWGELGIELVRERMLTCPGRCVALVRGLIDATAATAPSDRLAALVALGQALVAGLHSLAAPPPPLRRTHWHSRYLVSILGREPVEETDADTVPPVDSATPDRELVVDLLSTLARIPGSEAPALRLAAARSISARPQVFDPVSVVTPALAALCPAPAADPALAVLWNHCAEFLLQRSGVPPAPPVDWRQEANLSCRCADCRELAAFLANPGAQVHRFRVRQDRRQHLHNIIDAHDLAMTHVTERKGSPQTLVCTKDQRHYQSRCAQYRQDVAALATLAEVAAVVLGAKAATTLRRIETARAHREQWTPA